jgi:YHYH protein
MTTRTTIIGAGAAVAISGLVLAGCAVTSSTDHSSMTTGSTESAEGSTADGLMLASWGDNVSVSFGDGAIRYVSDGIPNHDRQAEYAVPTAGVRVPDASSAVAAADPTVAQSYDFTITTNPVLADEPTSTSLGTIGVMISGAALFNPYEGDGSTVATASNFTVLNDAGQKVAFLDTCNGHPTPTGTYHYHALPRCITAVVDEEGGPSHILGVAFDGFPIYGDRALDGTQLTADDLDECSGITSATPEFPDGIYHYVLLDTADSTSSIRCFSGVLDESLVESQAGAMAGMHP